jgi:proteasome lid subunit RPN8/RPN11
MNTEELKNTTDIPKILPKIIINTNILNKIKYLCQVINTVEWSGVLLYTTKGSIKKPEKFSCIIQDIIPMDKGTYGGTEFRFNTGNGKDKHIDYMLENEKAIDWKIGTIHSHHNMATFFSGTDNEDLKEVSKGHNFYLSVVVNNRLDIKAKIACCITAEIDTVLNYKGIDEKFKPYVSKSKVVKQKVYEHNIYDCEIVLPKNVKYTFENFFNTALEEIIKEKEVKEVSGAAWNPKDYSGAWNMGRASTFHNPSHEEVKRELPKPYISKSVSMEEDKTEEVVEEEGVYEKLLHDIINPNTKNKTIYDTFEEYALVEDEIDFEVENKKWMSNYVKHIVTIPLLKDKIDETESLIEEIDMAIPDAGFLYFLRNSLVKYLNAIKHGNS